MSNVVHALTLQIVRLPPLLGRLVASPSRPTPAGGGRTEGPSPPLSHETAHAAVSGILEPAYAIGGDLFDYDVFNRHSLDFAFVDATGHGLAAVVLAATAINSLVCNPAGNT